MKAVSAQTREPNTETGREKAHRQAFAILQDKGAAMVRSVDHDRYLAGFGIKTNSRTPIRKSNKLKGWY